MGEHEPLGPPLPLTLSYRGQAREVTAVTLGEAAVAAEAAFLGAPARSDGASSWAPETVKLLGPRGLVLKPAEAPGRTLADAGARARGSGVAPHGSGASDRVRAPARGRRKRMHAAHGASLARHTPPPHHWPTAPRRCPNQVSPPAPA